MKYVALVLLLSSPAFAFGKKAPDLKPTPTVTASPSPTVTILPVPSSTPSPLPISEPKTFVTLGKELGPSVNKSFALESLSHMNRVIANGCVKMEWLKHSFKSLKNIDGVQVKDRAEAYKRYVAGAPYALDLRWYYKGWPSKVVGYTYNYRAGSKPKASETRIYSNTAKMGTSKRYAAHLAHELSHQARAGAFVHYSFHQGSVPYEAGDIFATCIAK